MGQRNESHLRPSGPLKLIIPIFRHLITTGYGGLRFVSYFKEGLGALRVAPYCELQERGEHGEILARPYFDIWSFSSHSGFTNSRIDRIGYEMLSDAEAASIIVDAYGAALQFGAYAPSSAYVAWFDGLISVCGEDGFPITEEPSLPGFGPSNNSVEIIRFSGENKCLYPRPDGFSSTRFQEIERRRALQAESYALEKARLEANRIEWKRRVSEIDKAVRKLPPG